MRSLRAFLADISHNLTGSRKEEIRQRIFPLSGSLLVLKSDIQSKIQDFFLFPYLQSGVLPHLQCGGSPELSVPSAAMLFSCRY